MDGTGVVASSGMPSLASRAKAQMKAAKACRSSAAVDPFVSKAATAHTSPQSISVNHGAKLGTNVSALPRPFHRRSPAHQQSQRPTKLRTDSLQALVHKQQEMEESLNSAAADSQHHFQADATLSGEKREGAVSDPIQCASPAPFNKCPVENASCSDHEIMADAALEKSQRLLEQFAELGLTDLDDVGTHNTTIVDEDQDEMPAAYAEGTASPSRPASPRLRILSETAEVPVEFLTMLVELWESMKTEQAETTRNMLPSPAYLRKPVLSPAALKAAAFAQAVAFLKSSDERPAGFATLSSSSTAAPAQPSEKYAAQLTVECSTPTTAPASPVSLSECSSPSLSTRGVQVQSDSTTSDSENDASRDALARHAAATLLAKSDDELLNRLQEAMRSAADTVAVVRDSSAPDCHKVAVVRGSSQQRAAHRLHRLSSGHCPVAPVIQRPISGAQTTRNSLSSASGKVR